MTYVVWHVIDSMALLYPLMYKRKTSRKVNKADSDL
jgi:hypothetical protein